MVSPLIFEVDGHAPVDPNDCGTTVVVKSQKSSIIFESYNFK